MQDRTSAPDPKPPIESVWDYPRPPRLEATSRHLHIVHCGIVIADTTSAFRVLETSHPPVYYIAQRDIGMDFLRPSARGDSFCEFKGSASYWTIDLGIHHAAAGKRCIAIDAAWSYPNPVPAFAGLRDHLAFYASRVDECLVDGERVIAQDGDFYGGWITSNVTGPFKGASGTMGW